MYFIKLVVTYHFCVKSKLIKTITNAIFIKLIRIIFKIKKADKYDYFYKYIFIFFREKIIG